MTDPGCDHGGDHHRAATIIGEAMDVLADGTGRAPVLTAIALLGRARVALDTPPVPVPDDGCARCHLYRTELEAVLDEAHSAHLLADHATGRHALLASRVDEWVEARAAAIAVLEAGENPAAVDQRIDRAANALAGTALMIRDLDLLTDVILVSRASLHRRDRTIAAYRLAELCKGP